MNSKKIVYNQIGHSYDTARKADPEIADKLVELLQVQANKAYLDMGCGSGNYTVALFQREVNICGLDISQTMLNQARQKQPTIVWHEADAAAMPFADANFAGIISVLATHHMHDLPAALKQAYRVLQTGRLVIFTATPEQMQHYWLQHYFPKMMQNCSEKMLDFAGFAKLLKSAGFTSVKQIPYYITDKTQDKFLHAGKYSPQIYLDEKIRNANSGFKLFADQVELPLGLEKLAADIKSGQIEEIIKKYEHEGGDYCYIVAEKPNPHEF
ncbi:MAG: class I SAM-dependent methyltransferase [Pseudomonadota bacterium]